METSRPSNARKGRVLIVDDEPAARAALLDLLKHEGYDARAAADGYKALGELKAWDCELLLTDLRMPMMDGLTLLRKAKEIRPDLACILLTAFGSVEGAVEAMQSGADDFLLKPVDFDALELVVARAFERLGVVHELNELKTKQTIAKMRQRLVGKSAPMADVGRIVEQVAPSRATVLITGESGTGKELVARMVHDLSPRADRPFIRVHCAALAETLLESELFGHEKGSFTGAASRRRGRFEEADGGTLFLDEIGEISHSTQIRLLRFLQEREFERVGGNETIHVNVRVVAATNKNLEEEVEEGRFRQDLFYRLNVINIRTPPLRACRNDIALIAKHFVSKVAAENAKTIRAIAPKTVLLLEAHDWPGNVRELENVIERAVVLARGDILEPQHLPPNFGHSVFKVDEDVRIPGSTLSQLERFAIMRTYEATGKNTAETASILKISVRKVQYKLKSYKVE